ncbi:hypothetical protein [Chryseobacterium indologenes]|nr:hypothetical protein [Chryseobacterium indologenes]
MKKQLIYLVAFLPMIGMKAQVGVNTNTPKATLDVTAKADNTLPEGMLAPRLTRAQLTAKGESMYTADQNGTIVYITDISGGNTTGQRVRVTHPGYYYFDSGENIWKTFLPPITQGIKTQLVNDGTQLPSRNTIGSTPVQVANGTFTSQQGGLLLFVGNGAMSVTMGSVTVGYELWIDNVFADKSYTYYDNAGKLYLALNFPIVGISKGSHTWSLRINGNTSNNNNSFVDSNHRLSFKVTEVF